MRKWCFFLLSLAFYSSLSGQIRIPASGRLAGPLDSIVSNFGDEFYNFPDIFGGRAEPGSTFLSGWIDFRFGERDGDYVDFTMTFEAVGTPDGIVFPGGQTYTLLNNRAFSNPSFVSKGRVNVNSGQVDKLELHALFQNSVIAAVTKNIRIPYGFINDYPPANLPIDLPFDDDPSVFEEAEFKFSSDGTIINKFKLSRAAAVISMMF